MEVKTCFDKIGSECDQMVKDQWKGPIQISYDRCVDIGELYTLVITSKEPVCPRVELILKVIIILLIIFLGFIKSKPC